MTMASIVKRYIEERGVAYELINHPVTGSSHETAEATHIDEEHLAKAVIVQDTGGTVMAVVPGSAWVSLSALGKELSRDMELAEEEQAARHFPDCDAGAIPPLGPAYGIVTVLDEAFVSLAYVYFESGDHRTLVKVNSDDFLKLLSGVRRGRFCHEE